MRSQSATRAGKQCPVDFTLKITSCTPEQLQVVSEVSAPLDESCQRIRALPDGGAVRADLAEFLWVRPTPSGK